MAVADVDEIHLDVQPVPKRISKAEGWMAGQHGRSGGKRRIKRRKAKIYKDHVDACLGTCLAEQKVWATEVAMLVVEKKVCELMCLKLPISDLWGSLSYRLLCVEWIQSAFDSFPYTSACEAHCCHSSAYNSASWGSCIPTSALQAHVYAHWVKFAFHKLVQLLELLLINLIISSSYF